MYIREFHLVNNSVAERSELDIDKLARELDDIDVSGFNLDWQLPEINLPDVDADDGYYGDERERTADAYNLGEFDPERADGWYQMPRLRKCMCKPQELISFNYVLSSDRFDAGVHFFIDDYQFERIWSRPEYYIEKLSRFDCVLTPDFSLYMDMPMAMKVWNVYRSRLFGQMCQDAGLKVIPTASWAEASTYNFCFDGLPAGGTLAVSTVGVARDPDALKIWTAGMDALIEAKAPKVILLYGSEVDYNLNGVAVKRYENKAFKGEN